MSTRLCLLFIHNNSEKSGEIFEELYNNKRKSIEVLQWTTISFPFDKY